MKISAPTLTIITLLLTTLSCKKNDTPADAVTPIKDPVMIYTDLSGQVLKTPNTAIHIDINKDGTNDVHIKTLPVGATDRYELQFLAATTLGTFLSIDENDQTAPFQLKNKVTITDMTGHHWYDVASVALMKNIVPAGAPYWTGNWQDLTHVYLPVMQTRSTGNYAGWIELSTNTRTGTVELHRAAISTEPNVPVSTGI